MRIRFNEDHRTMTDGLKEYKKGQEYDVDDKDAVLWVRSRVATAVDPMPDEPRQPEAEPVTPAAPRTAAPASRRVPPPAAQADDVVIK